MFNKYLWIILLIVQCALVTPRPTHNLRGEDATHQRYNYDAQNKPKDEETDEQVISVRITSSVAVGRGNGKAVYEGHRSINNPIINTPQSVILDYKNNSNDIDERTRTTEVSPKLVGANIEFIKQLNAKKDTQGYHNTEPVHPFQMTVHNQFLGVHHNPLNLKPEEKYTFSEQPGDAAAEKSFKILETGNKNQDFGQKRTVPDLQTMDKIRTNRIINRENMDSTAVTESISENRATDDPIAEPSNKSIQTAVTDYIEEENLENVPLARSLPLSPSSQNYIQGPSNILPSERGNSPSLTTVSFNVLHDTPSQSNNYNKETSSTFTNSNREVKNFYEPPKVYSQPAKIYSEPAKFYSEPAKVYSEPAKIYSEPAKIYSEPAKIYSEPAKFYSEPASLHLSPGIPTYTPWPNPVQSTAITNSPWQHHSQNTALSSTLITTTPTTLNTLSTGIVNTQRVIEQLPEKNYEVDEKISVLTDGRSHGVQETSTEKCRQDNCKVGYVVEGRQYKKYRVEERTPDGFIVGEYGVVRNEDGALRGVRYTADGDASPRLIYDALMKFLQLK